MSRRSLFGSLLGTVFVVNLARVIYAPLVRPLLEAFPVGSGTVGLVVTLAWLGSAVPRIPVGYLLTYVSRERVIAGSGALLAIASAGAAVAPSIEFVALGAFLMGLASGAYFMAANPLVSELFPERVGRAIGIHGTAAQLAAVSAAPVVAAVLLVGDFRLAFVAISLGSVLVTALVLLTARRTDLPGAGGEDRDLLGAIRAQWPLILVGLLLVGFVNFAWNGVFNFYEAFLVAQGVRDARASTLLTVVFAAGVPAFWFAGRLADRLSPIPLALGIVAAFVACLFALTVVSGFPVFVVLSLALGYVIHSLFPVVDTYLLESLPDRHRASAYSVYSGVMMIVAATGSSVVGALHEFGLDYATVFRGFGLGLLVVLAGLALLYRSGRLFPESGADS